MRFQALFPIIIILHLTSSPDLIGAQPNVDCPTDILFALDTSSSAVGNHIRSFAKDIGSIAGVESGSVRMALINWGNQRTESKWSDLGKNGLGNSMKTNVQFGVINSTEKWLKFADQKFAFRGNTPTGFAWKLVKSMMDNRPQRPDGQSAQTLIVFVSDGLVNGRPDLSGRNEDELSSEMSLAIRTQPKTQILAVMLDTPEPTSNGRANMLEWSGDQESNLIIQPNAIGTTRKLIDNFINNDCQKLVTQKDPFVQYKTRISSVTKLAAPLTKTTTRYITRTKGSTKQPIRIIVPSRTNSRINIQKSDERTRTKTPKKSQTTAKPKSQKRQNNVRICSGSACGYDVMLLVDVSSTTQSTDQLAKSRLSSVADAFTIDLDRSHLAMTKYSGRSVKPEFNFKQSYDSQAQVRRRIERAHWNGGKTDTEMAMKYAHECFTNETMMRKMGVRSRDQVIRRILVVFTDGYSQTNPSEPSALCRSIEKLDVIVIGNDVKYDNFYAGVGVQTVNKTQLLDMAGGDRNLLINLSPNQLRSTFQSRYPERC